MFWFVCWEGSNLSVEQRVSVGPVPDVVALWESHWTLFKKEGSDHQTNQRKCVRFCTCNISISYLWPIIIRYDYRDSESNSLPLGPTWLIMVPPWNRKKLKTPTHTAARQWLYSGHGYVNWTPTLTCWPDVWELDMFWQRGWDLQRENSCSERKKKGGEKYRMIIWVSNKICVCLPARCQ